MILITYLVIYYHLMLIKHEENEFLHKILK
jgi:hypothetical protein